MATNGRRTDHPVEEYGWGKAAAVESWLFAEGYRFDFFQAVRLLEMIDGRKRRRQNSPEESGGPTREVVRFRSSVSLDFPASDVAEVRRQPSRPLRENNAAASGGATISHSKRETPAEMTVNFLGLAGGLGALETATTELILQRASRQDEALKDFLDIFNHRLVSLLYRIRKHHRVALGIAAPGEDEISNYLYSLIGLGTPNLRGRMQVRDRSLLYYAGILAQKPRSMVGLERILADYFQVQVKGHQFAGEWCELDESQWTTIGVAGGNQRLGQDTVVVGTRVWDQEARFEIELGPLSFTEFFAFLPTNWRFGTLCDLIRFYVEDRFRFNIRLTLSDTNIGGSRLVDSDNYEKGLQHPETLGLLAWTSRLKSESTGPKAPAETSPQNFSIIISPESLRSDSQTIKSRMLSQLPRGKQAELLTMVDLKQFQRNEIVMLQGKPSESMFVIRKGQIQISRNDRGNERLLGVLGPGDSFGELALLTKKPYSETALTLEECEISEISRNQLEEFLVKYRNLRNTIDAYLENWLQANDRTNAIGKRR
jgi:type VI secretion system protein ImpH